MKGRCVRWTDEELAILRDNIGKNVQALARLLPGRSEGSINGRRAYEQMSSEQKEARKHAVRVSRGYLGRKQVRQERVKDDIFVQRDIRLATPRTLTAQFFGDPPPGYSALDRKRQERRA